MSQNVPGGWSEFTCKISAEARASFDQATKGLLGVSYSPVAVASQVVNGINYKFLTNAMPVYPEAIGYGALVDIDQPTEGKAHIMNIKRID